MNTENLDKIPNYFCGGVHAVVYLTLTIQAGYMCAVMSSVPVEKPLKWSRYTAFGQWPYCHSDIDTRPIYSGH